MDGQLGFQTDERKCCVVMAIIVWTFRGSVVYHHTPVCSDYFAASYQLTNENLLPIIFQTFKNKTPTVMVIGAGLVFSTLPMI